MVSRYTTCALLGILLLWVGTASAANTRIEGEYQLMLDMRKLDRPFPWDFDFNHPDTWTGAQLRLLTVPFTNTEFFLKVEADWNPGSNDDQRPVFQYRESHLFYKFDRGAYGADVRLFQRQDRFWVDTYLIDVVRSGNLSDGGNSQGVRVDLRGPGRTNAAVILSDFSGQSNPASGALPGAPTGTDDAIVIRLRSESFGDRLRIGTTYNRRSQTQAMERKWQEVWAFDFRYRFNRTDLLLEFADTRSSNTPEHIEGDFDVEGFSLLSPNYWLPSDANVRGELRTLRAGNSRWGYYNVVPTFWYYGPGYTNPLGDGTRDEQGFWINSWYLVPQRAITATFNYLALERNLFDNRRIREFYGEIYMEWVNGFTSKLSYNDRQERDLNDPSLIQITDLDNLFAEVQVESRLAWMRVQGKIRNIGTPREKTIASLESSVNLTSKLKIYGRYAFGNDPARLRKGLFTQLQYRPRGNMEIFLEHGPSWIGDTPNPVDDGDLEGSADQRDLIKLIVKGTF